MSEPKPIPDPTPAMLSLCKTIEDHVKTLRSNAGAMQAFVMTPEGRALMLTQRKHLVAVSAEFRNVIGAIDPCVRLIDRALKKTKGKVSL